MIRIDNISKSSSHRILFIEASAALNRGEKIFLDGGVIVESGAPRTIFSAPERERTKKFIASLSAPQSYDI